MFQIAYDNFNRPDAYLYHLPYVNIINENKLVIGVYNLHYRFGHTSIFQYISALYNNNIFDTKGIALPLGIFFSNSILYFYSNINKQTIDRNSIFSLAILIFLILSYNRYSNLGNDGPAHLMYFIIINELLKAKLNQKSFQGFDIIFIFSVFTFLNKISLVLIFIIIITILLKKNNIINILKFFISKKEIRNFFFLIFFTFGWITKNILVSGCVAFPLEKTCFKEIKWHDKYDTNRRSNAKFANLEVEAWAKGISDSPQPQKQFKEYIKNFYWVNIWIKNHGFKILKEQSIWIFILLLLLILTKQQKFVYKNFLLLDILIFLNFVFTIIWFLKFPTFRYGLSYIISFMGLLFTKVWFLMPKKNLNLKKIFKVFSIMLIVMVHFKYLKKFDLRNNTNPWPKIFVGDQKKIEEYSIGDTVIYFARGTLCGYYKSPCTNQVYFENKDKNRVWFYYKDLKYKKIFNYKMYYFSQ